MFHLQQKCFLKLLDLSPEEITGLLDLAADLKKAKYTGTEQQRKRPASLMLFMREKILPLFLKKPARVRAAPLRLQPTTWV